jgi:chemotaxis protein methyltransferase WspC
MAMPGELRRIEEFLTKQIGLDPMTVGPRMIVRAAQHRMNQLKLGSLSDYEHWLYNSKEEIQSLIEQVVVPESWFFRDARPYQWFCTYIRLRWVLEPARPPVRVLSLACAGGEEPYSIAMTMSDLSLAARRFGIDAVDVSARQLTRARQGVYSANAFRGSDLNYRSRFFREHPGGFEIDPAIRSMVRFLEANVLDPQFFEGSAAYDVIFCRNLLIYLDAKARATVTSVIDRLLAVDGVVIVGHADRFEWGGAEPKFTALDELGCFAHARTVPVHANQTEAKRDPMLAVPNLLAAEDVVAPVDSLESNARVIPANTSTAGATQTSVPANAPGSLLSEAALLANKGLYIEATAACERDLQLRGPNASAYHLLGMILELQGHSRQAEVCFHKAVYLDPNHDEALLALALLAERRGDRSAAGKFRRRAARIVAVNRKKAT